jgi:uracil-DNA glycosylase
MIGSVNLQEVKEKLYDSLKESGWANKLKTYLQGEEFDHILEVLLKEAQDGKRFTPPLKYVFKALELCPFERVKVVIIGQDPYPQPDVADGLAFSCSRKDKAEVSLQFIKQCIVDTVPESDLALNQSNDLFRWAQQGVLLLNTALTTTIGKPGTHQILWRSFIVNILDSLVWTDTQRVYVFMGKKAQEFIDLVPDSNHKVVTSHPASAAYTGTTWDCNNMFNKINNYLQQQSKTTIVW